ncbi:MAG: hypothetical protein AAGK14_15120 [Verrucomicrobiota bacterium]
MARPSPPNPIGRFLRRFTRGQLLGAVSGLLIILLGIGFWDLIRDDPPVDDADLLVQIQPAPAEANGLVMLRELGEELIWRPDGSGYPWALVEDYFFAANPDGTRDWPEVRKQLAEVEPILAQVDAIVRAPVFQHPDWHSGDAIYERELHLVAWRLEALLSERAKLALKDGDPDAAWEDLLRLLQLAQRLQGGNLHCRWYSAGLGLQRIQYRTIEKHALALAPDPTTTRRRTDRLRDFHANAAEFSRMIKVSYLIEKIDIASKTDRYRQKEGLWGQVVFKPNRTTRYLATTFREVLANLERPPREMRFPSFNAQYQKYQFLSGLVNRHGHSYQGYGFREALIERHEANLHLELIRVVLALAGYANQHGDALPPRLEDLVPDYLDALPSPSVSGNPIQYDPDTRTVWSESYNPEQEGNGIVLTILSVPKQG